MKITARSFKHYLLPFFVFVLSGCESENFYSYYVEEDLYRLPLIEPYRLTNLYGVDKTAMGEPLEGPRSDEFFSWNLEFRNLEHMPKQKRQIWINKVNVTNGIIYGYGSSRAEFPIEWFVNIPAQKIEKLFKDSTEWKNYLADKDIKTITVYDIWPIFQKFKKTKTLPWYNPEQNIFPTKQ